MNYFIYAIVDPRDDLVYYVGCTMDLKRRTREHRAGYCDSVQEIMKSLAREGRTIRVDILAEAETKEEGRVLEKQWIERYKEDDQPLGNTVYIGWNKGYKKRVFKILHQHWLRQRRIKHGEPK